MFDSECLKDRRTPSEPESLSHKPHVEVHAQKARVKHPQLQPGQDPLRLVGVLLWSIDDFHFLLQDPRTPEGVVEGGWKGFRRVLQGVSLGCLRR